MLLLKILNKNTIYQNVLLLFLENLNVLLHVLYKIKNKIHVKTEIAQNDTDLSCVKLDINVIKCCTKAQHFETLISNLIQDKSVSF